MGLNVGVAAGLAVPTIGADRRRRYDHVFFSGIAGLFIGYTVLGFWQSYFAVGLVRAQLPSLLVHVHAVLFVGWVVLFGVQNALLTTGNVARHRQLGTVMGIWAAAIVIVCTATSVAALRRPLSGVGAVPFAGNLSAIVAFVLLIVAGLAWRRNGQAHKRAMMLASAAIMGPAIIRWPFDAIQHGPPVAVTLFYLLPAMLLVGYDLAVLRRVQPATWLGLGLMVAGVASFLVLPAWPGWLAFTRWVQLA